MHIFRSVWGYLRGFRRERREYARLLKTKNTKIGELEKKVKDFKEELKTERRVNSGRQHLAGILKQYNEAARSRVYPSANLDIMRDQIRMLRDALIQEMAYTIYLSENIPEEVIDFNDLPQYVRQRYFRFAEESASP